MLLPALHFSPTGQASFGHLLLGSSSLPMNTWKVDGVPLGAPLESMESVLEVLVPMTV